MDAEPDSGLLRELNRLRDMMPDVHGCLVASTDGLPIASVARDDVAEGVAALAAACLGVSQRVVDIVGHHDFRDVVINGSGGYVAMYMVGGSAVLVLLAGPAANVGRLHHEARRAVSVISDILDATSGAHSGWPPPFA